ncbi:MAG: calcium-binding protein [Chloroflexota bacterium]|nr:calcium-binding protein [Chloroflexota bacterium]
MDCYGEHEEFAGVMCTLGDELRFPFKATVVGESVEVVGIDGGRSGLRRGIVARVRRGGQEYRVSLAELELVDPDLVSAEWLEVYRCWLSLGG